MYDKQEKGEEEGDAVKIEGDAVKIVTKWAYSQWFINHIGILSSSIYLVTRAKRLENDSILFQKITSYKLVHGLREQLKWLCYP